MTHGDKARNTLLKCAEIVAEYYGVDLEKVAECSDGDRRFFDRMKAGKNLTIKKYDEVSWFLAGHWPPKAAWPKENALDRPDRDDVRKFMTKLPKKRHLTKPKNWRNKFLESPSVSDVAVATLAPTRSKPIPPGNDRVGDFVED